jgi:AraC-like DNA-binding protein
MPHLTQLREPSSLREQSPAGPLTRWVECGWFLDTVEPVTGHPVPPDGCLDIVYEPSLGLSAIGTMTREQHVHFPKGARVAGVRFRPGMAGAFLGVSPAELTDTSAPLEDFWPRRARELKRHLDDARSAKDALQILLANLPAPADITPTQRAIEALTRANGNADLDSAAKQANLSPRQFRRRCLEESGLTPKRLCRVLRFRHVCRMAGQRDRLNWSALALEAEYFDQAHLIRDFQEFTGHSPMAVFSNTRARNPR